VKPLTRKRSAATRPHVLLLIVLALALAWTSTAEAGRRGRKAKKARARADASAKVVRSETPASSGATGDGAPDGARLANNAGSAEKRGAASKPQEKVFDFSALELGGSERMPQLLYFLDRAEEELERASLERRSFVPEMMRSLDEENL
jgi:hypothetical protein